jgi:hypothetical protein|nr:MAG TPA: hypothetical protein [Caudoviricetes sp.]
MKVITISSAEQLREHLIQKHKLPEGTIPAHVYRETLDNLYDVYAFNCNCDMVTSYHIMPWVKDNKLKRFINFKSRKNILEIEHNLYDADKQVSEEKLEINYEPFDLIVVFKNSDTILHIPLGASDDVIDVVNRYANKIHSCFV